MKKAALMDLVALGEGFTTEFKRAGTSHLGREICAFANATGGTILIGVTDSGEVVGVGDHNRLKSEVQATAQSARMRAKYPVKPGNLGRFPSQACPKSVPSDLVEMILQASASPKDMLTLMALAGHTNRTRFRKTVLQPLIDSNLVELTLPDKPRSSKQRYRLTELEQELLKQQGKEQS